MFNKQLFKGRVVAAGYTLGETARALGINPATLHRKMSGESDFTRDEIIRLRDFLDLKPDDVVEIFFS